MGGVIRSNILCSARPIIRATVPIPGSTNDDRSLPSDGLFGLARRHARSLVKMAPAPASLRLPGTSERERRGNTEPLEGLFSRPDTLKLKSYSTFASVFVSTH